jgi:phage-related baseplate assembly protein
LEVGAYRKLLNRARINDAAKALLLAYAEGSDLEQLAGNVSLQRLVIQAADPTACHLSRPCSSPTTPCASGCSWSTKA